MACRNCSNPWRLDALASGHAAPEDAEGCEDRGLLAAPCGLSPNG
jgi:hypothetical protein